MSLLTHDSLAEDQIAIIDARLARPGLDEAQRTSLQAEQRRLEAEFPRAKGERDARIQFLLETPTTGERPELLRLYWSQIPNWNEFHPLLLYTSPAPPVPPQLLTSKRVPPQ